MLPDVGHDDRAALGRAPDVVNHVRRIEVAIVGEVLDVADRRVSLELVDVAQPRRARAGHHAREQVLEHLAEIADDADVNLDVLADLGRVDVDVHLARVGGVGLEVAGDAIVEAHAEGEQQVGLLDCRVDPGLAVHAHHAEVQRVGGGDAAESEQRHGNRDLGALGELADDGLRVRHHDAVAGEDQRPLGRVDQIERPGDRRGVDDDLRPRVRPGRRRVPVEVTR